MPRVRGRPGIVHLIDTSMVIGLREQGLSWREIMANHPLVQTSSGTMVQPSATSIRRVWWARYRHDQREKLPRTRLHDV